MPRIELVDKKLEVICQHCKTGRIIPIKLKFEDEDGELHTYNIKAYKDLSEYGEYNMPNHVTAKNSIFTFDCKIQVFDFERTIRIIYNAKDSIWRLAYSNVP